MDKISFEHQFTVEGYLTFSVRVISGDFSGSANFCISEIALKEVISALSEVYNCLKGTCQMNDYDSDDFNLFETEKLGHIIVTGQIGGSHRRQYLNYQFITEQTVLAEIISDFKNMLS